MATVTASPTGVGEATAAAGSASPRTSAAEDDDVPKDGIPGDGTFLVGKEVEPGTYRSEGKGSFGCYWARLSDTTGESDAIIANGSAEGPRRRQDQGRRHSIPDNWL
ncbi:hypothetical protein ABZ835_48000 [Streptomyces sp. NPDC047461]|uniref:hypothetical protein n=1 Tax=Streptomyces sp. NPDC047461 TaxID=3155619 RepID=UPI0033C68743